MFCKANLSIIRAEINSEELPMAKAPRGKQLGSGYRFKKLVRQLAAKGVKNPKALAAWIGRRKYGKKKFQQLAAMGRRQAAKKRKKK